MRQKDKLKLVGSVEWTKLRALLVENLESARTETEFLEALEPVLKSAFSNLKEINKKRRKLGIKELTKKEFNRK